jgi:hypothetical protein
MVDLLGTVVTADREEMPEVRETPVGAETKGLFIAHYLKPRITPQTQLATMALVEMREGAPAQVGPLW